MKEKVINKGEITAHYFGGKRKIILTLLLIFLLSFALRFIWVSKLGPEFYWADERDYDKIATNLIEGKGYTLDGVEPTAFRPPGQSIFLASLYFLFGHDLLLVRIVQSILGSLACLLVYLICIKLSFSQLCSILAGILAALYPYNIYAAGSFYPINLLTLLLLLATLCLIDAFNRYNKFSLVGAGICLGLGALSVPYTLILFLYVPFWLTLSPRTSTLKRKLTYFSIVSIAFALTVAPWLARNSFVFNKVAFSTNGGYNFWLGNNPEATFSSGNKVLIPKELSKKLDLVTSEVEKEEIFVEEALSFIQEHPTRFAQLTLGKALNFFSFYPETATQNEHTTRRSKIISILSYGPILILGILGMYALRRRWKEMSIFFWYFIYFMLVCSFTIPKIRFRLPLDVYLVIFASGFISLLVEKALVKSPQAGDRKLVTSAKKLAMIHRFDTAWRHLLSFFRHNTLKKMANLARAEWEIRRGRTVLRSKPYMIKIDPISFCNLSCPGCPSAFKSRTSDNGKMDFELYRKIIDELKDYLYKVSLYAWGEPLLNKEIYKMIGYATQNNIGVVVSSNMNVFSEQHAEQMVNSGLEHLIVAIDGATQESYSRYRIGGSLEKVIDNLRILKETKRRYKSKFPIVEMQFLLTEENQSEIPAIKELSSKLEVDRLIFKSFYDEEKSRLSSPFAKKRKNKCHWLWQSMVMLWDGSVTPCCFKNSKPKVGSVVTDSISQVRNSQIYVKSRELFCGEKISDEANKECTYCNLFV
ncbi:MAG: radical SAM protein [candidate division Zixibacteria bacterium]|nr:radical SAM protein [candidate division Zixibacteria bacterium]